MKPQRGRRPKPTAIRRLEGNRGKRAWNRAEPALPNAIPRCPAHLGSLARAEWRRVARPLHALGVLTAIDRAALAAYCQAYGRWVEAEAALRETPALLRTASGHIQHSPWLVIANRQLDLMGRYMTELGLSPTARSRAPGLDPRMQLQMIEIGVTPTTRDTLLDEIASLAARAEPGR